MYQIENTTNKNSEQSSGAYLDHTFWPTFRQDKEDFKSLLVKCRDIRAPFSLIRLGHADFRCFDASCGSPKVRQRERARANRRQTTGHIPDQREFCNYFESILKSDCVTTQIGYDFLDWMMVLKNYENCYVSNKKANNLTNLFNNRALFRPYNDKFTSKQVMDLPLDIVYGLAANKWFLTTFKNRVGLIGAKEKLECVEELMKYAEYQEYLGTDYFTDYVYIPQRAALSCKTLEEDVARQVSESDCDIFLIGAGCAKLRLFHMFKDVKNCIFIDVGHGIDLLAGWGDLMRPYCGSWQNYRVKGFSESVDRMGKDSNRGSVIYV